MSVEPSSQLVLRAELSELDRLSSWIGRLSEHHRLPSRLAFQLDLCLTELVTNVVDYAYAGGRAPADAVTVRFLLQPVQVVLEIEDRGVEFDPAAYVPAQLPASLEDAAVGGRGLRLVHNFAGGLWYRRDGGVNRVTMAFSLAAN